MINVTDKLKELRRLKGVSQREVSEGIGINVRSYRHYEAGDTEPTATNIAKLAIYFEVSGDYLLGLSDNPKPHKGGTFNG